MTSYDYDENFFNEINETSLRSAQKIVPFIAENFDITSVVDIGCGEGIWLAEFLKAGSKNVLGIDGWHVDTDRLAIPVGNFIAHDLQDRFSFEEKFHIAVCLEVAEHLPEGVADQLVESLSTCSNTIMFSAAIPGQGGHGHINEQPHDYWLDKFASYGYAAHTIIQETFKDDPDVAFWYRDNTFILDR